MKEVSGKDIDDLLSAAEDYLKRIKKLFDEIQTRRDKESVDEMFESCMISIEDALKANEIKVENKTNLVNLFKKHLVDDKKIFTKKHLETIKEIVDTKNSYKTKKLTWPELEKIRREARWFVKSVIEYVQRKRGFEFERAKIKFKYGNRFGEAILLNKVAYVIDNVDAKEKEVSRALLKEDGSLGKLEKSSLEELEKELMKVNIPERVFIKEKIFESLKSLFGKEIEILVNY